MTKPINHTDASKAVFAAFLNMARHNCFLILNHLHEKLGHDLIKEIENKEPDLFSSKVWNTLFKSGSKNNPEDNLRALNLLRAHFPFIPENQRPESLKQFFLSALKRINQERNRHTHYFYKDGSYELVKGVNTNPSQIGDLQTCLMLAKQSLQKKIEAGIERQSEVEDGALDNAGLPVTQLFRGLDEGDLKLLKTLDFQLYETGTNNFTAQGLAYFICLFLEKKYATQFISKLDFFKNLNEHEAPLLKEWVWNYCCRLPQPKLESGEISMDVLNYLYRAPKQLYNRISKEKQSLFEVDFQAEDEETLLAKGNSKTILKRHSDQFPYFAMRISDDLKLFDRLRFHIHLGKWLRKEGESTIIEERKIYENLRTFGRLGFFEEANAPKDWKSNDSESEKWYRDDIEQFAPHYIVTGNRIGIKFNSTYDPDMWYPLGSYNPIKKGKGDAEKLRVKRDKFTPDAILSTYELGALFLYQYLHKVEKDNEGNPLIETPAEDFLMDYKKRFLQFWKDVKSEKIKPVSEANFQKVSVYSFQSKKDNEGYIESEIRELEKRTKVLQGILDRPEYRLKSKDLPDALREYLLGYKNDILEEMKQKLVLRKKKAEQRLREIQRVVERIMKREQEMPTYLINEQLATDLTELIYEWKPQNANSYKFLNKDKARLNGFLLKYPHNKKGFEEFLKKSKLIDKKSKISHPFLDKAAPTDHQSLAAFYVKYLGESKKWFNKMVIPGKAKLSEQDNQYIDLKEEEFLEAIEKADMHLAKVKSEIRFDDSETMLNGDIATYLVRDIIDSKPKDMAEDAKNFGKPNSQEYQRLNAGIALYSMDKEGLVQLMKDLGLMGSDAKHPHPFLEKTDPLNRKGVKDFYEKYLTEKVKWLDGMIDKTSDSIEKLKKQLKEKYSKAVNGTKIKNYGDTPIYLPRAVFNEAINQGLSKISSLGIRPEDNFTMCVTKYVQGVTQPFFNFERTYSIRGFEKEFVWNNDFKDKLNSNINQLEKDIKKSRKKRELADEISNLKKVKRFGLTNEKEIRAFQNKDRLLQIMLRRLAEVKQPNEGFQLAKENISLSKISPEFRAANEAESGITMNLLGEEILMEVEVHGKTIIDKLPIKRYGEFRKFFKDRRLGSLLQYFDDSTIDKDLLIGLDLQEGKTYIHREQLVKELDDYDTGRDKTFTYVHDLEAAFLEAKPEVFQNAVGEKDYLDFGIMMGLIKEYYPELEMSDEVSLMLQRFRNALSHNQVYYSDYLKGKIESDEKQIIRATFQQVEKTYFWLISEVKGNKTT